MKDATQQMTQQAKSVRIAELERIRNDERELTLAEQTELDRLNGDEVRFAAEAQPDTEPAPAPKRRRSTPREAIAEKRKEKGPQEIKLLLHRETSSYTLLDSEEKEGMAKLDVLRSPDNYEIIIGRKLVAEINWK